MWRKGRRRAPVPVFHGSCHRKIHGFVVRKSFPGPAGQAYIVITFIIVTISFHQNAKIPQKQSFSGCFCGIGCEWNSENVSHIRALSGKTGKGLPCKKLQLKNTVLYISHGYGLLSGLFSGVQNPFSVGLSRSGQMCQRDLYSV